MIEPLPKSRWGDLLALGAGVIYPLAFAPLEFYFLAPVSLALLFYCWLAVKPRRALMRGFLFGVGAFGVGVSWIYISIATFGQVPAPLAVSLTAMLVLFLAWFPALIGYFAIAMVPGMSALTVRIKLIMVLPAIWTLLEWVRGWIFTGFPWLNVGYSQTDGPLRGIAPILGVYGVCFIVALSAGLLVLIAMERSDRARVKSAVALIVVWIMGAGSTLVQWTYPAGAPIRVALAQGAIPQAIKWSPDMRDATLDRYLILSREHLDADLIVWPETALPDFYHRQGEFLAEVASLGRVSKTDFLIGTLYLDVDTKEYYNSVVSVGPDEPEFYHKRHLVPFTEYLPLKAVLGQVVEFMRVPMSDFSSGGRRQGPITVAGYPVAVSICFEDAFGEELLTMLPAAKLLVNVSNDAWFGDSLAPRQHLQMARMRALETGRPMLRATNTGMTAITDHWGRILAKAKPFEPDAIEAQVTPMDGATPYVKVGNIMIVGLMCFTALFGVAVGRRATHYGI